MSRKLLGTIWAMITKTYRHAVEKGHRTALSDTKAYYEGGIEGEKCYALQAVLVNEESSSTKQL